MDKFNEPQKLLMGRLLAAHQAPWMPFRKVDWDHAVPAICARRRREVPQPIGGGNDVERQRHSRLLSVLQGMGIVDARWLTPEGLRFARAWTHAYDREEMHRALNRFNEALVSGDYMVRGNQKLVPESVLAGEFWGSQVGFLQAVFLPLLADGVLRSDSCVHGCVFYSSGLPFDELLAAGESIYEPGHYHIEEVAVEYEQEFKRQRNRMRSDPDYYSELGALPVPWMRLESGRSMGDVTGIEPLFEVPEAPVDG